MNKLIVVIYIIYCSYVLGYEIDSQYQKSKESDTVESSSSYAQSWIDPYRYGPLGQKYPGISYGPDVNRQERYEDIVYGELLSNGNIGQNVGFGNDDAKLNNKELVQGVRIGVNGLIGNNEYDRQDRLRLRGTDLRAQLLLNARLRAGLGLNAGLRAGLGLDAALRARLNAGLSLDATTGLRVGLDLSDGGEQENQEDIMRPCQMEDYQCIRKFFADNSQCSPSYGPAPDPLYLDQNTLYLPYSNMSYTLTNLKITGMANARISDLYINRLTGNVVLSIQINNLNETSPRAYLSYKRMGKEPIILADASTILFAKLTLTVVLPRIPNLRLDLADINAYIDDGAPKYNIGPKAYTSQDPDVTASFLQFSSNLGLVIREGFLLQAQLLAALFIQLNICDFGVNLVSY